MKSSPDVILTKEFAMNKLQEDGFYCGNKLNCEFLSQVMQQQKKLIYTKSIIPFMKVNLPDQVDVFEKIVDHIQVNSIFKKLIPSNSNQCMSYVLTLLNSLSGGAFNQAMKQLELQYTEIEDKLKKFNQKSQDESELLQQLGDHMKTQREIDLKIQKYKKKSGKIRYVDKNKILTQQVGYLNFDKLTKDDKTKLIEESYPEVIDTKLKIIVDNVNMRDLDDGSTNLSISFQIVQELKQSPNTGGSHMQILSQLFAEEQEFIKRRISIIKTKILRSNIQYIIPIAIPTTELIIKLKECRVIQLTPFEFISQQEQVLKSTQKISKELAQSINFDMIVDKVPNLKKSSLCQDIAILKSNPDNFDYSCPCCFQQTKNKHMFVYKCNHTVCNLCQMRMKTKVCCICRSKVIVVVHGQPIQNKQEAYQKDIVQQVKDQQYVKIDNNDFKMVQAYNKHFEIIKEESNSDIEQHQEIMVCMQQLEEQNALKNVHIDKLNEMIQKLEQELQQRQNNNEEDYMKEGNQKQNNTGDSNSIISYENEVKQKQPCDEYFMQNSNLSEEFKEEDQSFNQYVSENAETKKRCYDQNSTKNEQIKFKLQNFNLNDPEGEDKMIE